MVIPSAFSSETHPTGAAPQPESKGLRNIDIVGEIPLQKCRRFQYPVLQLLVSNQLAELGDDPNEQAKSMRNSAGTRTSTDANGLAIRDALYRFPMMSSPRYGIHSFETRLLEYLQCLS